MFDLNKVEFEPARFYLVIEKMKYLIRINFSLTKFSSIRIHPYLLLKVQMSYSGSEIRIRFLLQSDLELFSNQRSVNLQKHKRLTANFICHNCSFRSPWLAKAPIVPAHTKPSQETIKVVNEVQFKQLSYKAPTISVGGVESSASLGKLSSFTTAPSATQIFADG